MLKTVYDKDSYINLKSMEIEGLTKRLGWVYWA